MECCAALCVGDAVLNQNKTAQDFGIKAVLCHELLAKVRLQCSEVKDRFRVTFDDETHGPRAEVADAVEEDEVRCQSAHILNHKHRLLQALP